MKIAIIGRGKVLFDVMSEIYVHGYEIPLIITSKESPEYKKKSSDFHSFSKKIKSGFIHSPAVTAYEIEEFAGKDFKFDLGVSINYTGIINKDVINLFNLGILNMHTGDLPRYRGNAPIAWAILNQEEKIVNSIHWMKAGELDSGDILFKESFPLSINTKIGEVFNWVENRAPAIFLQTIQTCESNPNYILQRQTNIPPLRCYPRLPEDGKIAWAQTNFEIHNLIRVSSSPFAGAFSSLNNQKIYITDSEIYQDNEDFLAVPGQILAFVKEYLVVATGKGKILIKEVVIEDRILKPKKIIKSLRNRFI